MSDESMARGIDEEVRLSMTEEDYKKWQNKELPVHVNGLTIAYDMGWNKRSSRNIYDSVSGHGVAISAKSKKSTLF
jgi:hypothetical protein